MESNSAHENKIKSSRYDLTGKKGLCRAAFDADLFITRSIEHRIIKKKHILVKTVKIIVASFLW